MVSSPVRVLVVDDDAPTCVLSADILRRAGYQVTTASNYSEIARVAGCGEIFDVAVLDVVMPTITGDELARLLRARNPALKILFVTGFPGALFQAQPTLWEGQAFLEKPCTDRGLLEAISLLLRGTIAEGDSPAHFTVGSGCDADVEPLL